MSANPMELGAPSVQLPVMAVAEVQDSILVVMNDLHRLQGLLDHAAENLLDRFSHASRNLAPHQGENAEIGQVLESLQAAVTELQFHDMATQLIVHTSRILQSCAYRLAAEAMGRDEDEEDSDIVQDMPERPNPVTQSEMDAGSIDLF